MEPIINPWFFYFVDKADAIIMLFSIVSFIFIMCSLFMLVEDEDKKNKKLDVYIWINLRAYCCLNT